MKKNNNNKFRSSNNYNNSYSISHKFDSNSPAGKFSGTALDLIKKYNDLARDANNNDDYVSAEIFRQYAEHYRKIVTDINEKNNYQPNRRYNNNQSAQETVESSKEEVAPVARVIEIEEAKAEQEAAADKPKRRTYRKKAAE